MSQRVPKVESLIQHVVASALIEHLSGDAAAVTVTRVDVSPDLRQAIIWLGYIGAPKDVERLSKQIEYYRPDIQSTLAGRITTRSVPRLHFKTDTGGESMAEIDRLLKGL